MHKISKKLNSIKNKIALYIKELCVFISKIVNFLFNHTTRLGKATLRVLRLSIKKIFSALFIGIIAGLIVAFLLGTPKICLKDVKSRIKDKKVDLGFAYQNLGQSTAKHLKVTYIYGIDGESVSNFSGEISEEARNVHVGDVISYTLEGLPFENQTGIIFMCIKFRDESRIREFFNKKLSSNPYEIYKWMQYDHKRKKVTTIENKQKDSYENSLMAILNK